MTGWDVAHRMRLERLRRQRAIADHVVAVETLLDIYGDSPEQLRELVRKELEQLLARTGVRDV